MSIQQPLTAALVFAILAAIPTNAKTRGLNSSDDEVAKALPVQVVVLQPRIRPQIRYNFLDTSQAGVNAGNSLYNGGGMSYGQAMGTGLAGGLIAGMIINGAEKAAAKQAARDPYQLISEAKCDLPLIDSHVNMIANVLQRSGWRHERKDLKEVIANSEPRYVFTMSTSLSPDFSALMTTIDAASYTPGTSGKIDRKAVWQDSLVVVSDGLWLLPKTQSDIELMVTKEKQRYAESGADALISKVNAAGSNASRSDRKRALLMVSEHTNNMKEAKAAGWSDASTAMRRAALWSENNCALLEKTLSSNLEHADGLIQALFQHSLPLPGEEPLKPIPTKATVIGSTRPDPQVIKETTVSVGLPEGSTVDQSSTEPRRIIEAMPGGIYVSRLSAENIILGYRHMVLDE